jgi:hypothetical protein
VDSCNRNVYVTERRNAPERQQSYS